METTSKVIISVILGILTSFLREYGILTLLVCGALILDIITGIIKAKIEHKLNSKQGSKGFWKKVALLSTLAFGFFLDCLESYLISTSLGDSVIPRISFGMIIGIYIILNESISICENLLACGVKLPTFITHTLESGTNKIDKNSKP